MTPISSGNGSHLSRTWKLARDSGKSSTPRTFAAHIVTCKAVSQKPLDICSTILTSATAPISRAATRSHSSCHIHFPCLSHGYPTAAASGEIPWWFNVFADALSFNNIFEVSSSPSPRDSSNTLAASSALSDCGPCILNKHTIGSSLPKSTAFSISVPHSRSISMTAASSRKISENYHTVYNSSTDEKSELIHELRIPKPPMWLLLPEPMYDILKPSTHDILNGDGIFSGVRNWWNLLNIRAHVSDYHLKSC